MRSVARLFPAVFMFSSLPVVSGGCESQAQQFWSPRHVVLDTYTEPVPFPCDGKVGLAYEVHITNMDRVTIALGSVEVFAEGIPTPVKTYSGELLAESLTRIRVTGQPEDIRQVTGGQRAILHVLLAIPRTPDFLGN